MGNISVVFTDIPVTQFPAFDAMSSPYKVLNEICWMDKGIKIDQGTWVQIDKRQATECTCAWAIRNTEEGTTSCRYKEWRDWEILNINGGDNYSTDLQLGALQYNSDTNHLELASDFTSRRLSPSKDALTLGQLQFGGLQTTQATCTSDWLAKNLKVFPTSLTFKNSLK